MGSRYVCSGASLKCCCGSSISKLIVYPDRSTYLSEVPYANIADHEPLVHIPTFGTCNAKGQPFPCNPSTMQLWECGNEDYLIRNFPALLTTSYCKCLVGGIISIVVDGQKPVPFDVNCGRHDEVEKLKEQGKHEKGKELLLDAVEFIPVVGSIVGIGRSAAKGQWGMVALNAAFLVMDVATAGTASTVAKGVVKGGIKASAKTLAKEGGKKTLKNVAISSGEEALKTGASHGMPFIQQVSKNVIKEIEEMTVDYSKNFFATSAETGAKMVVKEYPKLLEGFVKTVSPQLKETLSIGKDMLLAPIGIIIEGSKKLTRDFVKDVIKGPSKFLENIQKIEKQKREISYLSKTTQRFFDS